MYKGTCGKYKCSNPEKCINGDTVDFKSKYEYKMMQYFDGSDSIIKWGYEIIKIPYISPIDSKEHMYIMDFYAEAYAVEGGIKKLLVEVKPLKQVMPPTGNNRSKKTKTIEDNVYAMNQAKWMYARAWCKDKGIEFFTITDNELYPFLSRQSTNKKIP